MQEHQENEGEIIEIYTDEMTHQQNAKRTVDDNKNNVQTKNVQRNVHICEQN